MKRSTLHRYVVVLMLMLVVNPIISPAYGYWCYRITSSTVTDEGCGNPSSPGFSGCNSSTSEYTDWNVEIPENTPGDMSWDYDAYSVIGTRWDCDTDYDWSALLCCLAAGGAGVAGCGTCLVCILAALGLVEVSCGLSAAAAAIVCKVTCSACFAALLASPAINQYCEASDLIDACNKDTDDTTDIWGYPISGHGTCPDECGEGIGGY